jgi:hypothetical protein
MKNTLACLVLFALAAACLGQNGRKQEPQPRPDLTGTWVLDKSKSDRVKQFDSTLIIVHRDPELKITQTDVRKAERVTKDYVFYTDERGESNPMYYGTAKFDSDTKWEGGTIVAYTCVRRYTGAKCHGADSQRWQISADGQTLTHHLTGIDYYGAADITKLVYRRAP